MALRKRIDTLLESVARTATEEVVLEFDPVTKGVTATTMQQIANMHLVINVTAAPGPAPSVVPSILTADPVSGTTYPLLEGSPITTTGLVVLKLGRDMEPAANLAARDIIPANVLIQLDHQNANSITYSVAVSAEFEMVQ